jgi:hypothetical protein
MWQVGMPKDGVHQTLQDLRFRYLVNIRHEHKIIFSS